MSGYSRMPQVDDSNMDPGVRAAVRQNAIHAEQVRQDARRRMPADLTQALAAAETNYRDATRVLQAVQLYPPTTGGDVRERALARLEWEERQKDAQSALAQAEQALHRARRAHAASERGALDQMLREAEATAERCRAAVADRVGGAWDVKQANALLASDPQLAALMRDGHAANTRAAEIAKAIRLLYP